MALHQVGLKPYEGACGVIIFDGAESMSEEAANALLKTLEEPPPQTILLLLTANEDALLPTIRSRCHRLLLRPTPKQQIMDKLVSEYSADPHQVEQLSRLSRGCFGWAINALTISELLERRKAELEQVRETTEASLESRLEYASELASLFSRDREAARQVLYLWQSWWRDLLLVKEGAVDYIHNTDWVAQLSLQAARLTVPQMTGFLKRVLQTLEALDRNANARLALEVMMLDLPVHPQNSP
jgi:DNA polymerase-3 subunit delta'